MNEKTAVMLNRVCVLNLMQIIELYIVRGVVNHGVEQIFQNVVL